MLFSYETTEYVEDQVPCWLTYTNTSTHEIIDKNLGRSGCILELYKGQDQGIVQVSKINMFDLMIERHQLFLEPEGKH